MKNLKGFVALMLVLQLAFVSPFSTLQRSYAASNTMAEKVIHEFTQNTWAYSNLFSNQNGDQYLSHVKSRTEIAVKKWDQDNWNEITSIKTSATGDTGFNGESDFAVDFADRIHAAFLYEKGTGLTSQRGVKYGIYQNGSWSFETVEGATDPYGWKNMFNPSVAVDLDGKTHIVYEYNDANNPRKYEIRYATNQSGAWKVSTIASGASAIDEVKDPQIEVDNNNIIHITYVKEDNQNNVYGNYYHTQKDAGLTGFSPAEKIVDAVADQKNYRYTPFVVDASGKIYFSYYEGNTYTENTPFTTYFQTNQSGTWKRELVYNDSNKITYPVKVTNAGSKSILLMYSESWDWPPSQLGFFTMVKDGGAWTKGATEVSPSLTTVTPSEITYSVDANGNFMVVMLDNGLRKISYIHGTSAEFGLTTAPAKSNNADLSNLTVSQGALSPGFSAGTAAYTADVGNAVQTIQVTPTVADAKATVKVNGTVVASGTAAAVPLNVGSNTITVAVTAEDGTTVRTYTITVTRAALSSNASLSNLTVSTGTLSPSFNTATKQYNVSVPSSTDQIRLTPTVADALATVTVAGTSLASGQESAPISLKTGKNSIPTVVTAQNGTTATYTVVVNRNSPPAATDTTFTVDENAQSGATVGLLSASDLDGDSLTYDILSGNTNDVFSLNSATGEIKAADGSLLDYETTKSYTLVIQVSDGMDTTTANVKINVNDLNDNRPVPQGFTAAIDENSADGTSVGTVTASDNDAGSGFIFKITAGNTDSAFAIDPTGVVKVADATKLDYETVKSFTLTVNVSDGANSTDTSVTINLNNVNDNKPVMKNAVFSVDENALNGTVVGTVSGSDADGDLLHYGIISGNESGAFTINAATGEIVLTDNSQLDYETNTTYQLTVQASDRMILLNSKLSPYTLLTALFAAGADETDVATITINVNDENDNRPVPQGFTKNIDENAANGSSVGTVTATDADTGSIFSYSIIAGNTNGAFAIDPSSGEITVADAAQLDYETVKSYTLTVKVSDGTFTTDTTVTIILNNVNDNKPVVSDVTFSVDENAANGTVVGAVSGSDADGDTLSYSIVLGNGADAFAMDAATGKITVADAAQLDYETIKSFTFSIKVSDGSNTADSVVSVNLNNLNDNTPMVDDAAFNVDENAANATVVGSVSGSDADGDLQNYSIVSGNETGAFAIDASTGKITVVDSNQLDYETIKSFALTVQVSDGIHTANTTVEISLNNVNDNPPVGEDAAFSIDEKAANGTAVGTVTASDADGDAVTYTISTGNDEGIFTINDTTGEITVADAALLDAAAKPNHTLSISASDGQNASALTVTVHVLSNDATLSQLTTTNGDLNPEFNPGTTQYTMNVGESVESINLTPTVANANATVKINGKLTKSGEKSEAISLVPGKNTITMEVSAENGQTITYTIIVTRQQKADPADPVNDGGTGSPEQKPTTGTELPMTATNMYNWLLAGMLILILGGSMILMQRLRQK